MFHSRFLPCTAVTVAYWDRRGTKAHFPASDKSETQRVVTIGLYNAEIKHVLTPMCIEMLHISWGEGKEGTGRR